MNSRVLSIVTGGAAARKERLRGPLLKVAAAGPVRRLRQISETIVTPRVRAELAAQSTRIGSVEEHLPRLLNTINSSDGSSRLLSRRLDQLRAELEAEPPAGYDKRLRWLDERLTRTTAELGSLTEAVRGHVETQAWLLGRVEMIRSEVLYELRYGGGHGTNGTNGGDRPPVEIVEPGVLDPDNGEIRLNLGCGHKPLAGYVNVDGRRLPGVEVVAPVEDLPVKPGTVAEIYSAHLLEHFPEEQLRRSLLPYWVGLLRPGGVFRAIVPDLEAMTKAYVRGELGFDQLRNVTYGGQEYEGDTHYNGFTAEHLSAVLAAAGLTSIEVIAQGRPEGDCLELELSAVRPA